jgi:hypothetical protein
MVLVGTLLATGSVPAGAAKASTVSIVFNVYSPDVVNQVVDPNLLRPQVRPGDVFVLVTGNSSGAPDLGWIADAAAKLHLAFPSNEIRILTSGTDNIQQLAKNQAHIPSYIHDVGYDYEPGRTNEREFTWDFAKTMTNFTTAASQAQTAGYQLFGAPTGRALLEADLLSYNWRLTARTAEQPSTSRQPRS